MKKVHVYTIILISLGLMILHLEIILSQKYAPETVLISVMDIKGLPETNASCFGDIISENINFEKKPLIPLESVYKFLDPEIFYLKNSKGYYYFETGFKKYRGKFEIRIVCYSPRFSGVSYTIINNTNNPCQFRSDGKVAFC
ncbi:MAG: hypothetical protein QW727_03510 [Candidatus Pacearchaeota archaeon]